MCGRARAVFQNDGAVATVTKELGLSSRDRDTLGSINIQNAAPGCELPILTHIPNQDPGDMNEVRDYSIQLMHYGLIPVYQKKDEKLDWYRMFNARSEGMASSPVFSKLLKQNLRGVLIINGFYEWKYDEKVKSKQPYYIYSGSSSSSNSNDKKDEVDFEHKPLYLAVLFDDIWNNTLKSFTILTTSTDKCNLKSIHSRMPVILNSEQVSKWIEKGELDQQVLVEPPLKLSYHKIHKKVGKSSCQDKDLIMKVKEPKSITSFFSPVKRKVKDEEEVVKDSNKATKK